MSDRKGINVDIDVDSLESIRERHKLHGKDSIAGLQSRYAWAHSDRGVLLALLTAETARADGLRALAEKWEITLDHGCAATFFECADELREALEQTS